jgi:hypothetical protein
LVITSVIYRLSAQDLCPDMVFPNGTAHIAPVAQLHNILTAYIAAWLQICNNQNASELGL